ncbi:MAG: uroporphyrinogen decarboxylase family protein [Phycisphaeraceae bacterium]|nr:uroporphyrinogen decarboxylase family protein [Phycisphaeraceae bacterium]
MTHRERILAVYHGQTPDVVPCMLDLSHWYLHKNHLPWDLSVKQDQPDGRLIEYHRQLDVGFYIDNLGSFFDVHLPNDVTLRTDKHCVEGVPEIIWYIETPLGQIERRRRWEERSYAWGISQWGIRDEQDIHVFAHAMSRRRFSSDWRKYERWASEVGDLGVVYLMVGYSAMGYLMHNWMGVEGAIYATCDFPDAMHEAVDAVNANILELVDLAATSPAQVVMMGDNFSSDIQPPAFFDCWTRPFYEEAIERLHRAGKYVAVHIDGRLRGAISMIRESGADAGDAITPAPMGDLTPAQCRAQAGQDFILSGGVSPELWSANVPLEQFKQKVIDWLEIKALSPRLILAAGDQVPPGAEEDRIRIMRDLVQTHGTY